MLTRRQLGTGALAASAAVAGRTMKSSKGGLNRFPKGFRWGAATTGHQVEGNNIASDLWVMEHVKPTYHRNPVR